jgi:hypothetical protein
MTHTPKQTAEARQAILRRALFRVDPSVEAYMARKGLLRGTGVIGETGYEGAAK